jgi:hypothetical protein
MELFDRYLNEIGRRLPKSQRDDVRRELRSALQDALDSRSDGEPTEFDAVAVLKEFGPPEQIVASYSGEEYLIGPKLYRQFLTTVRIVLTAVAVLLTASFALSLFVSTPGIGEIGNKLLGLMSGLFSTMLTSLGIIVIVFALLERSAAEIEIREKEWNPLDLPAVPDVDVAGRFDSIAGIVFPAIALIVINQFRDRIGIMLNPEGKLLLNDVFLENLPWINACLLLPMALSVWLFWSGRWHLWSRLAKLAFDVFGVYVLYRIATDVIEQGGQLVEAGMPQFVVGLMVRIAHFAPIVVLILVLVASAKPLYQTYSRSG